MYPDSFNSFPASMYPDSTNMAGVMQQFLSPLFATFEHQYDDISISRPMQSPGEPHTRHRRRHSMDGEMVGAPHRHERLCVTPGNLVGVGIRCHSHPPAILKRKYHIILALSGSLDDPSYFGGLQYLSCGLNWNDHIKQNFDKLDKNKHR
jgi:hypothetical protein